jgi:hypothetical protein
MARKSFYNFLYKFYLYFLGGSLDASLSIWVWCWAGIYYKCIYSCVPVYGIDYIKRPLYFDKVVGLYFFFLIVKWYKGRLDAGQTSGGFCAAAKASQPPTLGLTLDIYLSGIEFTPVTRGWTSGWSVLCRVCPVIWFHFKSVFCV